MARRVLPKSKVPYCSSADGKCNLKGVDARRMLGTHPHELDETERVQLSNRVRSSSPGHGNPLCKCTECPVVADYDRKGMEDAPPGMKYNPVAGGAKTRPLSEVVVKRRNTDNLLNQRDRVVNTPAGRVG